MSSINVRESGTGDGQGTRIRFRGTLSGDQYQIEYNNAITTSANTLDLRFVGDADAAVNRNFDFGHYTGNNRSNTWNSRFSINAYNGNVKATGTIQSDGIYTNSGNHPTETKSKLWLSANNSFGAGVQLTVPENATINESDLQFTTSDNDGNQIVRMTIKGSGNPGGGNVGIGTSTPNAKLEVAGGLIVQGATNTSNDIRIRRTDGQNSVLLVANDDKHGSVYWNRTASTFVLDTIGNSYPIEIQGNYLKTNSYLTVTGNGTVPVFGDPVRGNNEVWVGGFGSAVSSRHLIGDGGGWSTHWCSRTAGGLVTDVITFEDRGNVTISNNVSVGGRYQINGTDVLTANNYIKAKGVINGQSQTLSGSYNVSGINFPDLTYVCITFTNNMIDSNYCVFVTELSDGGVFGTAFLRTTSNFCIRMRSHDNVLWTQNSPAFCFVVV